MLGYEVCDLNDVGLDVDFEKVAIYAIESEVRHMARQLSDGKWTSKLGSQINDPDICHDNLEMLEGGRYGRVACIMRRRRKTVNSE